MSPYYPLIPLYPTTGAPRFPTPLLAVCRRWLRGASPPPRREAHPSPPGDMAQVPNPSLIATCDGNGACRMAGTKVRFPLWREHVRASNTRGRAAGASLVGSFLSFSIYVVYTYFLSLYPTFSFVLSFLPPLFSFACNPTPGNGLWEHTPGYPCGHTVGYLGGYAGRHTHGGTPRQVPGHIHRYTWGHTPRQPSGRESGTNAT